MAQAHTLPSNPAVGTLPGSLVADTLPGNPAADTQPNRRLNPGPGTPANPAAHTLPANPAADTLPGNPAADTQPNRRLNQLNQVPVTQPNLRVRRAPDMRADRCRFRLRAFSLRQPLSSPSLSPP